MARSTTKHRIDVVRVDTLRTITLVAMDCPSCGVIFALSQELDERRRDDGATIYCPNGHKMSYDSREEKERERIEAERDAAQRRADRERQWRHRAEEREAHQRRSAAAYRGHLTRMRNRVRNGVCPKGGCKRSFTDLAEHIRTEHPEMFDDVSQDLEVHTCKH